jgi:hypothetical protein
MGWAGPIECIEMRYTYTNFESEYLREMTSQKTWDGK